MHTSPQSVMLLQEKVDDYDNNVAHLAAECGNIEIFKVSKEFKYVTVEKLQEHR